MCFGGGDLRVILSAHLVCTTSMLYSQRIVAADIHRFKIGSQYGVFFVCHRYFLLSSSTYVTLCRIGKFAVGCSEIRGYIAFDNSVCKFAFSSTLSE